MSTQNISKVVGNNIKKYRKAAKLTQKELGEKIGVKHNTISGYESGKNEPEQNMLFALANVLGVSVNDFFPDYEAVPMDNTVRKVTYLASDDLKEDEKEFFKGLIEKTLSLSESERAKFLDGIRFAVEYHDKNFK